MVELYAVHVVGISFWLYSDLNRKSCGNMDPFDDTLYDDLLLWIEEGFVY